MWTDANDSPLRARRVLSVSTGGGVKVRPLQASSAQICAVILLIAALTPGLESRLPLSPLNLYLPEKVA